MVKSSRQSRSGSAQEIELDDLAVANRDCADRGRLPWRMRPPRERRWWAQAALPARVGSSRAPGVLPRLRRESRASGPAPKSARLGGDGVPRPRGAGGRGNHPPLRRLLRRAWRRTGRDGRKRLWPIIGKSGGVTTSRRSSTSRMRQRRPCSHSSTKVLRSTTSSMTSPPRPASGSPRFAPDRPASTVAPRSAIRARV